MKDLKVYYEMESEDDKIDSDFDKAIERIAKRLGLSFQGSGVEIGTGIRDIHYKKEKK